MVPVFPAIFFGVTSKKITYKAAVVSVLVGIVLATIFVIDQLLGPETGKQVFPFLHSKLTLNFGYRALWAELFITAILFTVSAFTEKTDPARLEKTTIDYSKKIAPFEGLKTGGCSFLFLIIITLLILLWLS